MISGKSLGIIRFEEDLLAAVCGADTWFCYF